MTLSETDTLVELIHERHTCLRSLLDLGRRQLELIKGGELGHLLTLLASKQRLLFDLQSTGTLAVGPVPAAGIASKPVLARIAGQREQCHAWRQIANRCWPKSWTRNDRPKRK